MYNKKRLQDDLLFNCLCKAEDDNALDLKFEGTASNDSIKNGLQSFNVSSLVTDGGRVDCKYESNKWRSDLGA